MQQGSRSGQVVNKFVSLVAKMVIAVIAQNNTGRFVT